MKTSLKPGVTGIMRIKDDALFIERSIESCIGALDELVIVYNDCSDESPEIIERMRCRYPDKIKVYPYEHHVLALNLSKEEYDEVLAMSNDDPRLLCNYYNYALDMVSYQYAVKIDADQVYFEKPLKDWCDFYRTINKKHISIGVLCGLFVFLWMKFSYRLNRRLNKIINILPNRFPMFLRNAYKSFVEYCIVNRDGILMISGVNAVNINDKWYVPFGKKTDSFNILPPFNGTGDHVFFKVTEKCYYKRFVCPEYSKYRSEKYSVIEQFVCPGLYLIGGYFWYHLNQMRPSVLDKVKRQYDLDPSCFISLEDFLMMNYSEIDKKIPMDMYGFDARSFSQFAYAYGKDQLIDNIGVLRNYFL